MNELIEKRNVIERLDAIQIKAEKLQALIGMVQSMLCNEDITILLDIINDYSDQVLEQTEELKRNLEEDFNKDYKNVISIA